VSDVINAGLLQPGLREQMAGGVAVITHGRGAARRPRITAAARD